MQKITYEYKGIKITIESVYTDSDVEVAEALLLAQEKLPKVFSKTNLNKLGEYQDVIPKFLAIKVYSHYRINKMSFLQWLLGYKCNDLSDRNFRFFTCEEIQDILGTRQKTAYETIKQSAKNKWFEVNKIGRIYRVSAEPFLKWMDGLSRVEKRFD